ncbi:MAG: thrombospondin type 3 repeat-containing protein [Myxococcales bacterium]|nr:thrombospondin type 3 repeat-containing protein [Myxococcales bacterium]
MVAASSLKSLVLVLGLSMAALTACSFSGSGPTGPDPVADDDEDGILNAEDNCLTVSNADQADGDSDKVGNACDNCPTVSNADQVDGDEDKVGTVCDNCPMTANADQADGDGDKVGSVCDNCAADANPPVETLTDSGMKPLQRDHDGDGRGDVCDFCPHLSSTAQDADGDGDKIGAPCDPDDAVKNPPAEFNGFYDPPVVAEWGIPDVGSGLQGDWTRVLTPGNRLWWKQGVLDGNRHLLRRVRATPYDEVYVATLVRLHQAQAGGLRSAGAAMGYEFVSPTAFYFLCGVRHDTATMENRLLASAYQDNVVESSQSVAWNPVVFEKDARLVGGTIRLNGGGGGDTTITCRGTSDDPVNSQTTQNDSPLRPPGPVGLRTFGATASFDYIFIVDKAAAPAAVQ